MAQLPYDLKHIRKQFQFKNNEINTKNPKYLIIFPA